MPTASPEFSATTCAPIRTKKKSRLQKSVERIPKLKKHMTTSSYYSFVYIPFLETTYIGRISFSLDNIEDRDITALLGRRSRDHPVLGLQETTHHIQNSRLSHRFRLIDPVTRKGRVGSLKEVAFRGGDQGGNHADEVVVHVSWISKCCRARRHHRRHLF